MVWEEMVTEVMKDVGSRRVHSAVLKGEERWACHEENDGSHKTSPPVV